jgi:hypothetical protein
LLIAGALIAVTPGLRAQEATRSPPAPPSSGSVQEQEKPSFGVLRVVVASGEDDLLLTIAQRGNTQTLVSCYRQCSFLAVPGTYTLSATNREQDIQFHRTLQVGERTSFWVSPGNRTRRTVGWIAGIAGPIAMVVGLALAIVQVVDDPGYQCNESNCPTSKSHPVGPALFFAGLLATPIGWTLFALNGPSVDPTDLKLARATPPRDRHLELGLVALPRGGWGLGFSTPF